jgi:hypothetical protein
MYTVTNLRRYLMPEELIGKVSHFFPRPFVAAIELTGSLRKGEKLRFKGHTTDFEMVVDSMQIDNADVDEAGAGDSLGVKVTERVREGDSVFKVSD